MATVVLSYRLWSSLRLTASLGPESGPHWVLTLVLSTTDRGPLYDLTLNPLLLNSFPHYGLTLCRTGPYSGPHWVPSLVLTGS